MTGRIFAGTCGWSYKHWVETFYPEEVKTADWLLYYSQYFNTVEVNATFYRLPEKQLFDHWYRNTPAGFAFTLKASRSFTHLRRMSDPHEHMSRFLESAIGLQEKLHMVLFQLPQGFSNQPARLEALLAFMHEQQFVPGVASALEIRDPSWYNHDVKKILSRYKASLVFADWPGFTNDGPATSHSIYLRRHGPDTLYASDYTEPMLNHDAVKIAGWLKRGKDVYVYYNNDAAGFAVKDALRLKELLADRPE